MFLLRSVEKEEEMGTLRTANQFETGSALDYGVFDVEIKERSPGHTSQTLSMECLTMCLHSLSLILLQEPPKGVTTPVYSAGNLPNLSPDLLTLSPVFL